MPSTWHENSILSSAQIDSPWYCSRKVHRYFPVVLRLGLAQHFVNQLGLDVDLDYAMAAWWWDARPGNGLRLTDAGFTALQRLPHWQFDIADSVLTPRNLLALDRFMTCAYFLRRHRRQHTLILFGDRESMMANLYGDVERFIASLES
jgi:hypothetical protein